MTSPLATFATLNALRVRAGLADTDTTDNDRMLNKLRAASAQIRRYTGRDFLPVLETRRFNYRKPDTLLFRGMDMLELYSVTNGDGTLIDSNAILTIGTNGGIVGIELDPTRASFVYNGTPIRAIAVNGLWGWHDDYSTAFHYTYENIPAGGIGGTNSSVTVTNVAAADQWGIAPRLQVGHLIRVDSEFMFVTQIIGNVLSVVRGVHGTLPVAHSANAPIFVYAIPADIAEITLRWAAWLLKQEDSGDYGGQTSAVGIGRITIPPGLPADLRETLMHFRAVTASGGT